MYKVWLSSVDEELSNARTKWGDKFYKPTERCRFRFATYELENLYKKSCRPICMHIHRPTYSLNKKEWICSLFKEWILEKSEIRVNLEWTFVLFTQFGVTSGITRNPWVIPEVTPKWVNNTNVHSKFTLISLFSKIHSLKSEHIHSFLFREYEHTYIHIIHTLCIKMSCMHAIISTHTHTHTYIHACMIGTYTQIQICTHAYIHTNKHTYIQFYMYAYI